MCLDSGVCRTYHIVLVSLALVAAILLPHQCQGSICQEDCISPMRHAAVVIVSFLCLVMVIVTLCGVRVNFKQAELLY